MSSPIQNGLSALQSNAVSFTLNNIEPKQGSILFNGGYSFNFVDILSGCVDAKTKNYSLLYLTKKHLLEDSITTSALSLKPKTLLTRIKNGTSILSIELLSAYNKEDYDYYYNLKFVPSTSLYSYFVITFVDPEYCTISYTDDTSKYFITLDSNNKCILTKGLFINDTFDAIQTHHFKYILNGSKLLLFKVDGANPLHISPYNSHLSGTLIANSSVLRYSELAFDIDTNIDISIDPSYNTSYVEYLSTDLNINTQYSDFDLKNNYLVYKNLNIDDINKLNIITLKNQATETNEISRANNLAVSTETTYHADLRNYTSICNDIDKETDEGLELNYVIYNKTIPIKPGKNYFTTEASLFPFSQININDTKLISQGAFSFYTPQYADKVYVATKLNTNTIQTYLCTWLSGGPDAHTSKRWVDRYYYPDLISKTEALQGVPIYNETYNSFIEATIAANQSLSSTIASRVYFDKISDLAFRPSTDYIYERFDIATIDFSNQNIVTTAAEDYYTDINDNKGFLFAGELINPKSTDYYTIKSKRNNVNGGIELTYNSSELIFTYNLYDSVSDSINTIKYNFSLLPANNNTFIVSMNSELGVLQLYINGVAVLTELFPPYYYNNLLFGDIYDGDTNITQSSSLVLNTFISNTPFSVNDTVLFAIKQQYTKQPFDITLPGGMRNKIDFVTQLNSLAANLKSKSNYINIQVNNLDITDTDLLAQIKNNIAIGANDILPVNININSINISP